MINGNFFHRLLHSRLLFYLVLSFNLALLCFTRFYPSLDGPAHLYNSNVLLQLIMGNRVLSDFYTINPVPVPNWSDHAVLSVFHAIMPGQTAEKLFIMLYVAGMALSFRYLIKTINPENAPLSILIFPFIYSLLFHLGLYNYSISFILFFFTLGFWLRNHSSGSGYSYCILCLLLTASYFTNVLIFAFLGLTIGAYTLYFSTTGFIHRGNRSSALRSVFRRLVYLLLVSVPGVALFLLFITQITFEPASQTRPVMELLKWINDVRPLIVYNYTDEEIITNQFFHLLLALLTVSFFVKQEGSDSDRSLYLKKANILTVPLLVSLTLLFAIPPESNGGMMSERYCGIFYILVLTWIVSRAVAHRLNSLIVVFALLLHGGLLVHRLNHVLSGLDGNAVAVHTAGSYANDNSIVLPVNLSDNWLEWHFSSYMGADKPLVILENYEADYGWFPIKWNTDQLPEVLLGDKSSVSGIRWKSKPGAENKRQIDHILVFGNTDRLNEPEWEELREALETGFRVSYRSENNYAILYERVR